MTSKYSLSGRYVKLQACAVRVGRIGEAEALLHSCYLSPHLTPTPLMVTEQFSPAMAPHKIPALAGEQGHISNTSRMTSVAAQLIVLGKKGSSVIGSIKRTVICKFIKYSVCSV